MSDTIERLRKIWANNPYYDHAEPFMQEQWDNLIYSRIKDCDFSYVVDLACGRGRNSVKLAIRSKHLVLVDICQQNLEACQQRFSCLSGIEYLLCDGQSIPVQPDTATLVYCFDAMVHFDPVAVFRYIEDCAKVLRPDGIGFFHHSNYSGNQNGDWRHNPHARNHMTQQLFVDKCKEVGLSIVSSDIIDWGTAEGLDCITVVKK